MILNSGLDAFCTNSHSFPDSTNPAFTSWIYYACFGTSSVAPSVTDTLLGAQVGSRSSNAGGFDRNDTGVQDAGTNKIRYAATVYRVFTIAANVNATEWGLAAGASGALSVRELFRADPNDPGSSPITLTLEAGDELQLFVNLTIQSNWEYVANNVTISGAPGHDAAGSYSGEQLVDSGYASPPPSFVSFALAAAAPASVTPQNVYAGMAAGTIVNRGLGHNGVNMVQGGKALQAYTAGSFYRDTLITFSTSQANGNIYGIVDGAPSATYAYTWRFRFTNPAYLTKVNTQKLTLTKRCTVSRL